MTPENIIDLFRTTMLTVIVFISVIIIPGLIIGLIISIFQAATQINEQTLSFIPRLIATIGSLIVFGPWILGQMLDFAREMIENVSNYIS